jgi:MFS family permease
VAANSNQISNKSVHRALVLYFSGYVISMTGTAITQVADGWLAYRVTSSEFFLGANALLLQIPYVLFAFIAISMLRRVRLKKCLFITYCVFGVSSLAFGMYVRNTDTPSAVIIVLFSLSQGLCAAVEVPARLSILPLIVPRQTLGKVLAWTSINWNLTRLIGPVLAGWIIFRFGESWCFLLDGLSYLFVAALILLMPIRDIDAQSDYRSVREASGAIWRIPDFRLCSTAIAISSAITGIYMTFLPVWIEEIRDTSQLLGYIRGLVGFGGVLSAVVLIYRRDPEVLRTLIPLAVKMQTLLVLFGGLIAYATPYAVVAQAVMAFGIGFLWTIVGGGGNITIGRPDLRCGV